MFSCVVVPWHHFVSSDYSVLVVVVVAALVVGRIVAHRGVAWAGSNAGVAINRKSQGHDSMEHNESTL